jgi:glycosyltransferase involved in cell wall biosynthesis
VRRRRNRDYTLFLICRNNIKPLKASLPTILKECERERIVAFDSESEDGTDRLLKENRIKVVKIKKSGFSHGRTRNLSLNYSKAEVFVFLNGDAIPVPGWLNELIKGIDGCDAAFSRQIPDASCDPLRITDLIHHPYFRRSSCAYIAKNSDNPIMFDTVSCAIRRETLAKYNLPDVTFGEDFLWAQLVVRDGGRIFYAHNSVVIHSHSIYKSVSQIIRRHFEEGRLRSGLREGYKIGYFLKFLPSSFLLDLMTLYLIQMPLRKKVFWLVTEPFLRTIQLASFYVGLHHNMIPERIKREVGWV